MRGQESQTEWTGLPEEISETTNRLGVDFSNCASIGVRAIESITP